MIAKYGVTRRHAFHPAVRPAARLLAAGLGLAALAGCGSGGSPQVTLTPAGGQNTSSGPGSGSGQGSGSGGQQPGRGPDRRTQGMAPRDAVLGNHRNSPGGRRAPRHARARPGPRQFGRPGPLGSRYGKQSRRREERK